jgi:uncharacterized protein
MIKMEHRDLFTGMVPNLIFANIEPYLQIAQYLSERGFAVLRYDKRGIGANFTIDLNAWGYATINDLIQDSKKALNALIQQPEVDPERISLIGHGEGAIIATRVAIDNSTKVKTLYLWARQLRTFQI